MYQRIREGDAKQALFEDQLESSQQYLTRARRVLILRSLVVGVPNRFDQFSPALIMDDMMAMIHEDPSKPITLLIDSPGGNIDDGLMLLDFIQLINQLKMSPTPITTIGLNVASMSTLLLAAGHTRLVLPHSSLCMHLPFATVKGDIKDINIRTKELERTKVELINCYIRSGVTAGVDVKPTTRKKTLSPTEREKRIYAKILKDIDRDFWLNAREAVEYGLADRIATPEELFGV